MRVNAGTLSVIVGHVGSGKTSLLMSILGEMSLLHGEVLVRGRIAYASQSAFILNATLRDNILFGRPFDAHRYHLVVDAC